MSQILLALVALANLIVSFTKAVASAARLNEVFALRSELVDGECEKAEAKAEAVKVKMEHVTFCYPGSQEPALEDISFTAKAGETMVSSGEQVPARQLWSISFPGFMM